MGEPRTLLRPLDVDFSAKVRWRMAFDRNPLFVTLQDKYKVREYAESKGVRTARLFHATTNPDTIPFDNLPPNYLIKATHGCGWNILCFDSRLYLFGNGSELVNSDGTLLNTERAAERELSREKAVELCRHWLATKYSKREWAYRGIIPRIVVEELLEARDGEALKDYRMYTFHGSVKAINVGSAVFRRNSENAFFDAHWNEQELTVYKEVRPNPLPRKPDRLAEMVEIAQRLGEGMDFARVDLYDTTQGVVLGEITIYPEGGARTCPTHCPVFNKWLGDQWKLSGVDTFNAAWWNVFCRIRTRCGRIVRGRRP
jgi:hypothetical protein